ncbi:hypothetical protein BpHYR1_004278 [Brachionus plicatilis]|uniref:Uncharacterized protein n=1 Tax=Brachionus plicatilis TaxID=10195 RepID=A0A3M7Q9C4_BRAPC|nr:hypothetical protein BpHYR1_004278 [Brachionus plicatilis]
MPDKTNDFDTLMSLAQTIEKKVKEQDKIFLIKFAEYLKVSLIMACANSLTKITDFIPILLDEYKNDLHFIKLLS